MTDTATHDKVVEIMGATLAVLVERGDVAAVTNYCDLYGDLMREGASRLARQQVEAAKGAQAGRIEELERQVEAAAEAEAAMHAQWQEAQRRIDELEGEPS